MQSYIFDVKLVMLHLDDTLLRDRYCDRKKREEFFGGDSRIQTHNFLIMICVLYQYNNTRIGDS